MSSLWNEIVAIFLKRNDESHHDVKEYVDGPLLIDPQEFMILLATADDNLDLDVHLGKPGSELETAELNLSDVLKGKNNFLNKLDYENNVLSEHETVFSNSNHTRFKFVFKSDHKKKYFTLLKYSQSTNKKVNESTIIRSNTCVDSFNNHNNVRRHNTEKINTIKLIPYSSILGVQCKSNYINQLDYWGSNEEINTRLVTTRYLLEQIHQKKFSAELKTILLQNYHSRLKRFGQEIILLWKSFYKRFNNQVRDDQTTLITLPMPFMVPGGRFIENYYWDTYWICLGLLATGKPEIVKDTLINFFYLVERCGFIPNGTRMYYQDRSQPPILSSLLRAYFYETHDLDFIAEHVKDLEKEYNFWMNQQFKHCITVTDDEGKSHTLNRYYSSDTEPRPESYRMDYEVGKVFVAINRSTDDELRELFRNIHAGAESGWDFSARWLRPAVEVGNTSYLTSARYTDQQISNLCLIDIDTINIIPCDLNALLYLEECDLAFFYSLLGLS
uniref:Trehalase n=1 Tax=Dermatophagoides pteronyssinus TaxID=6956 RepID=A0A6P6YCY8_DERPT|nr:trehalase-like [Dermatophagoides pteronyssinus]